MKLPSPRLDCTKEVSCALWNDKHRPDQPETEVNDLPMISKGICELPQAVFLEMGQHHSATDY